MSGATKCTRARRLPHSIFSGIDELVATGSTGGCRPLAPHLVVRYNRHMVMVRRTQVFERWLNGLKDKSGRSRILLRLDRLAHGNAGRVAPIGRGLSELKINAGPGYRVYFMQNGDELILLLCGGDKSSQSKDIADARELAAQWRAHQKKEDSND